MTLEAKAMEVRRYILETALAAGKGHVASSLSWVEIAVALKEVMKQEDRLVLSNTHCHLALDALWPDPQYPMRPGWTHKCSGSLGQGLGMAAGMALANKLNGSSARVYCGALTGDAELHEGAIWEAVMFAAHHGLRLIAIIDDNHQSCANFTRDILDVYPHSTTSLKHSGWAFHHVGGHNAHRIIQELDEIAVYPAYPACVLANTTKGKGISFMEGNPAWHHQIPTGDQIEIARKALA